jgi:thiol-disulfide isomerase/thioredoxin
VTQNNAQKDSGALRGDQNRLMFQQGFSFSGYERDGLFLNQGGKKFLDISGASGIDSITDGRAAVFTDFDNDGDYDVFLTTLQGPAHLLFRNNVGQDNHWLRIVLEGDKTVGRDAYGSVVRVRTTAGTLTKVKAGGSGYLAQSDPRLLFGLGKDERAESVEVTWPNGDVEPFRAEATSGSTLLLRKGTSEAQRLEVVSAKLPDPISREESFQQLLKLRIGQPLPDLRVQSVNGQSVPLRSVLRPGHRTLINVWATWCAPCRKEMPELERLRPALAMQGVDLIGLNVDADSKTDIAGTAKRFGAGYPIYVGGAPALENLFATDEASVPFSIVVDDKGNVVDLISGWSDATRGRFLQLAAR